jgi:hypothetical protein
LTPRMREFLTPFGQLLIRRKSQLHVWA